MIPQRSPSPVSNLPRQPLPPGHFLSLPPSYAQSTETNPSGYPTTSSHTSNGLAPNTSSLAAADFQVDVRTGFLPGTTNLSRLSGSYEIWEKALDAATGGGEGQGLKLGGGREREKLWRQGIESMPIVPTGRLRASLPLLQRAHLVLTFLLHFYAHTSPATVDHPLPIPASISVPLITITPLLGLPPILTYADTVLYNFHALDPSIAPSLPLNPPTKSLASFTGTRSEEQFYIISALCEIAGADALRLMRQSLDELFLADEKALRRLTRYLRQLAVQINRISDLTMSMLQEIDPEEFYHLIRPWFKGGDADGKDSPGWAFMGLAPGADEVVWEAENKNAKSELRWQGVKGRKFSGPSAGQSSLIHAIDVFLTVDHSTRNKAAQTEAEDPTTNNTANSPSSIKIELDSSPVSSVDSTSPASAPVEATYLERMLSYMPLPHRTFLIHLSTHPTPLRQLVIESAQSYPKLADAYDGALEALKRFREKHMRIVSVFIVQQARREPSARIKRMLGQDVPEQEEILDEKAVGELRGTGGTELFKFLKMCRDNTTRAMVSRKGAAGYDLIV